MRLNTIKNSIGVIALAAAVLFVVASPASAQSRIEFGLGFHDGDPELSAGGASLDLDTDTGVAGSLRYWRDGIGSTKNISVGIEYLGLRDGDFKETATFTGVITGTGTIEIEPKVDALLINVAFRDNNSQKKIHPYIGVGAGIARVDVDISASFAGTVGGTPVVAAGSIDDDDTGFAWQGYVGVDFDLGNKWYAGLDLRYFGTDVKLFGVDVEFRNVVGMAKVGVRF